MKQDIKIDFPLNLCGVNVDKTPRTYYLTISVILNLNNGVEKAIDIQKEILRDINAQNLIGSGIYKYPRHTIHFSVIDFEGLRSSTEIESEFKEGRQIHIDKIKNILQEFNKKQISDKKVEFAYIYTKNPSSIAIKAFPSKELCEFFKEVHEKCSKDVDLQPTIIKSHESENSIAFSVNIARFFRKLSNTEYNIIAENIMRFNKQCDHSVKIRGKPSFDIEINHISFVFSDNWLSNQTPELYYIELK